MDDVRFRELMGQVKAGQESAMDVLLVASFAPLRSAITYQLSDSLRKAQLEPEDVIQEVYSAAWTGLPSGDFDGFDAFLGWLRQIAENKLIDLHRAMQADKRDVRRRAPAWGVQSGTYVNLLDQVNSPMSTPSQGAARSEAVAILMVKMQQLPEDYRKVIHWRLIKNLPVAEVARRLNRTESAVHMLCHRAMKELRTLMGDRSDYLSQS